MSNQGITWVNCNGYKLVLHRASTAIPPKEFRFTSFDEDGTEYVVDLTTAHSVEILQKILRVIANRWPNRNVEVRVDDDRVISDIRSPTG